MKSINFILNHKPSISVKGLDLMRYNCMDPIVADATGKEIESREKHKFKS